MKFTSILAAGAMAVTGLTAQSAAATVAVLNCASLDGSVYFERTEVTLAAGDQLTISDATVPTLWLSIFSPLFNKHSILIGETFVVTEDGIHQLGFNDGSPAQVLSTAAPIGAVTCTPGAGSGGGSAAASSGAVQSGNILLNIQRAGTSRSGAGVDVSRNGLFAESGESSSGTYLWGYADFARMTGDASGNAFGVTIGADKDLGSMRAGMVFSFEAGSLTNASGETDSRSIALGPYISGQAGAFDYDAYVAYAVTNYSSAAGDQDGNRWLFGLSISGDVQLAGGGKLSPFARYTGFRESLSSGALPADELGMDKLSVGARVDFAAFANGMSPYASLAGESVRFSSDLNGNSNFFAPRLGFGVTQTTASGGQFGVDFETGKVLDGVRDLRVGVNYAIEF